MVSILAFAGATAGVLAGCVSLPRFVIAIFPNNAIYVSQLPHHPPGARKIFPFSIVPGGVDGPDELQQAIHRDPVIRGHYAGINIESLVMVRTNAPMLAFVSYRKEGKILWTRRPLHIPSGEPILTDGKYIIRSRCGNRLENRLPPNVALSSRLAAEPREWEFDTALIPGTLGLPGDPAVSPPVVPSSATPVHPEINQLNATPEPGTVVLFITGVAMLVFWSFGPSRVR